jgi:hypothetical protein
MAQYFRHQFGMMTVPMTITLVCSSLLAAKWRDNSLP